MVMSVLRRISTVLSLLVFLGVMLSACGSASTAPTGSNDGATTAPAAGGAGDAAAPTAQTSVNNTGGGATVTFWSRDSGQGLVEPLVAAWNKSHSTQIKATFIPADQFIQKFSAAMAGGQPPDLIAVDLVYMPAFSAADQMTDITDLAKSLPYFDKLSPPHMRLGTYQGKIYSLPFNADGSVLVYNKNLFKQAGLDPEKPPTTWAEMADYSKKITALGNGTYGFYFSGSCGGCNAFTMLPYIWASGGDVLNEDGTKATLTDPRVKEWLTFARQLWVDKQVPESAKADTGTDFFNVFTSGKIGMVGTGSFAIATLKNKYPDLDFGIAPLPGKEGGSSSFAGGDTIAIPKGSPRVNEAFEFMKWYLSDDVQVEQLAKNNGIPLRTDLIDNKYSKQDPRYITVGKAMYGGKTVYSLKTNQLFNDASAPWLSMLQKAIFDGQIDQAITEGQDQFTQIIGR